MQWSTSHLNNADLGLSVLTRDNIPEIGYIRDMMEAQGIKSELKELIEREDDVDVLMAIKTLLLKTNLDPEIVERMSSRALKAEKDIIDRRVMTREELEEKLNARLGI
ncbi:hypothetical protein [Mariniradius sediminis]|uniref:Uncharacterized protein n=1 Tax=Mariniradius sediminis TaxID=2909237 RepID=A0ABS9BZQ3_9BACT|nr:hypothetical protein [Mariniradius sediminis]MCF1753247.1 hypothetical protein [Mariniradius sediminis]